MPRHHTMGHPAKWIEPVIVEGVEVTPGYTQPPYQEDVPLTAEEELERDAEEIRFDAKRLAEADRKAVLEDARITGQDKLAALGLTPDELEALRSI